MFSITSAGQGLVGVDGSGVDGGTVAVEDGVGAGIDA
jgi:hypothetical protein